jgi:hypothetical protein
MQNSRTRLSMQRENKREKERKQKQRQRHRAQEREKEQRKRRRRRRKQRERQKNSDDDNNTTNNDNDNDNNNNNNSGSEQITRVKDPLATVPLEEEKGRPRDIEDPNKDIEADDVYDDDDSYSSYSDNDNNIYFDDDDDDDDYDYDNYPLEDLLPELNYVITIPDDLYRRMVGEMSAKAFPPYFGFFGCCNLESGRADIKLALVILTFVMLLLFVGSLEWRTT